MNAMSKKKKNDKSAAYPPYEKIHKVDPLSAVDEITRERIAPLENYIMKNCLWQFNSRGWDRRKQNAGIIGKTTQLLCGEEVENATPIDKCYWADAVLLSRAYVKIAPWLTALPKDEIKSLMKTLHDRMDWLTIDGSLNEELIVQHY